jgi:glycine hydroxymethyltransferase
MLDSFDPEVSDILRREGEDPCTLWEMRPSRNYLSAAVLEALSSSLADLYVEGHSDRRFTWGSQAAEELEALGIDRLKKLFDAEDATLQPSSHAQALAAVLEGLLKPGDTVMAPEAGQGCHLAFGHPSSLWAERYRFVRYGPDPSTQRFDPDAVTRLAEACNPALLVVSIPPYPRKQDFGFWRDLAHGMGALLCVDMGIAAGLVAGGCLASPAPQADVVAGATHGILRGPPGGFLLFKPLIRDRILHGLFPRLQAGTAMNGLAAKTVALKEAASPDFKRYVQRCLDHADGLSRLFEERGVTLWTGGTDYHYLVVNLRALGLSGKEGELRLRKRGIAAQKIPIAFERGCAHEGDGLLMATQALVLKQAESKDLQELAEMITNMLGSGA